MLTRMRSRARSRHACTLALARTHRHICTPAHTHLCSRAPALILPIPPYRNARTHTQVRLAQTQTSTRSTRNTYPYTLKQPQSHAPWNFLVLVTQCQEVQSCIIWPGGRAGHQQQGVQGSLQWRDEVVPPPDARNSVRGGSHGPGGRPIRRWVMRRLACWGAPACACLGGEGPSSASPPPAQLWHCPAPYPAALPHTLLRCPIPCCAAPYPVVLPHTLLRCPILSCAARFSAPTLPLASGCCGAMHV